MSHEHIRRLAQVDDEYEAAQVSVTYAKENWASLHFAEVFASATLGKLRQASAGIEATYTIRLFSAFEAILRDYLPRRSPALPDRRSAYELINKAASSLRIPNSIRDGVQLVREFRNSTVHEGGTQSDALTFDDARTFLNKFLAWLL